MMEYQDDVRLFNFLAGLVCGALIGAGIALALAPESGERTRLRLQRAAGDLRETASDRWDEIADDVVGRVEDAREGAKGRLS